MTWFEDVTEYILRNMEGYAETFLTSGNVEKSGKHIKINPCPFCGHQSCFSLTRGFNGAFCFSCKASGSLINIVEQINGEVEARRALSDWSGIKYTYASYSPKQSEAKEKFDRFQRICQDAVNFYHLRFVKINEKVNGKDAIPHQYQQEVRKHEYETLMKYKVGYSGGMKMLKEYLLNKGYSEEEFQFAKKEMIGFPEGYFLYPYYDHKGNLVRINAKLFMRTCFGSENSNDFCDYRTTELDKKTKQYHEKAHNHSMSPDNLSKGAKQGAFLFSVKESKNKKYLILAEGENDVLSMDEALSKMNPSYAKNFLTACIGGNSPAGMFKSKFLRQFDEVYEVFDKDDGGEKYREQLNREMPEVKLKHIEIPGDYNDIDEFLKLGPEDAVEQFEEMLDSAIAVPTMHYVTKKEKNKHEWSIRNRYHGLKYSIDNYRAGKGTYTGKLHVYKNGICYVKKPGDIDTVSIPGSTEDIMRLRSALSDKINDFYHNVRWGEDGPMRDFESLLDIFKLSKYQKEVKKQLAWYLYHADKEEREYNIERIRRVAKNETEVAVVLKEITGFQNQDIDLDETYPKLQLSQSLFPESGDAFMYFCKVVQDGEDTKRVPCLLSNKKEEIRLDIMKRKEPQSLLLVNGRYELPEEVEVSLIPTQQLSLQHPWVRQWLNGKLEDDDISPARIIAEIETFIRQTYYASPEVIKVVSLWIYATYYNQLFTSGFPYLLINGSKGTGKSTIDLIVQLLAFNPTFTVNTTEAALFRRIDFLGGTVILDEQENLTDSKEVDKSGIAAILKAGYAQNGEILRTDPDTKHARGYQAFGPKVISNIRGLDDVIADRCIRIDTQAGPEQVLNKLENPFDYKVEKRKVIQSITSRAAISALTYFQQAYELFKKNTRIDTGNARLTQLLRPLVTMARLVGGDYEEALMKYYETAIKDAKADVKMETLDGKIEQLLTDISAELLGKRDTNNYINMPHIYDKPIFYDKTNGVFEINSLHFKVYAQEMDSDKVYDMKEIHQAIKTVLAKKNFDLKKNRRPTKATINDDNLIKQLKGNKHINVYSFYINVRDFVPTHTEDFIGENATEPLF